MGCVSILGHLALLRNTPEAKTLGLPLRSPLAEIEACPEALKEIQRSALRLDSSSPWSSE